MATKAESCSPCGPFDCVDKGFAGVRGAVSQMIATAGAAPEPESKNLVALTRLFEQRRTKLVLLALRITHNQDEAEDIVQEAATRALVKLQTFRGESRLETWIYAIVRNCAISRLRSPTTRRMVSLDSELSPDQNSPRWVALEETADPEENCLTYELSQILHSEMEALRATDRAVIQLCDFEGWSCLEAAGALKLNQNTLKARLYRGRRSLRERVLIRVLRHERSSLQVKQFRVHTAKHPRKSRPTKLKVPAQARLLS
jgi:RNA polymerase sigma-70 factor, ECF subfamily